MIENSLVHSHLSQIETRPKLQTNFANTARFGQEKKECYLAYLKTTCVALFAWAVIAAPTWAQSKAERVLQSFASDFATTGVAITKGSKSVSESGAEWRNVVLSIPRIKGQVKLGFIRVTEQVDGSFRVEYPRKMTGTFAPVSGLAPLNFVATGDVSHLVSSAERGAVHTVSTDSVAGILTGANPSSEASMKLTNFKLEHTADRGVPLRLERIRDWLFSGALDVDMQGGFALLDTLVARGEITGSQAGAARMMASSLATQGPDGDDHLQMRVDVHKNGDTG